jgi:ribulose-5-phosphate 4-epimerase/fuculose-1-phosphate aldolase
MSVETELETRRRLIATARAVSARRLSHGSTGNVSVRLGKSILVTPTRSSMATVEAHELAVVDADGTALGVTRPSKETPLHVAIYSGRPSAGAVVHTHSTYATAVSCLADIDPADALPALTAYYAMRVERLPLIDYYPPGDVRLAERVRMLAPDHAAMLLRNHGVVVAAASLDEALEVAEEVERTAEIFLLLAGRTVSAIAADERTRLYQRPQ